MITDVRAAQYSGHISHLGDVLTPEVVAKHVRGMSSEELEKVFGAHLPAGTPATADNVMEIVRSGFFHLSMEQLSEHLSGHDGSGMVLSQAFGTEYLGEGLVNWLQAMRKKGQKEDADK